MTTNEGTKYHGIPCDNEVCKYVDDDRELHHPLRGPAIIFDNGDMGFFVHGDFKYMKTCDPTLYTFNFERDKETGKSLTKTYKNKKMGGIYHREDAPSKILHDGCQKWYKNGELHRDDGPAWITGSCDPKRLKFFVEGKQLSKEKYIEWQKTGHIDAGADVIEAAPQEAAVMEGQKSM